MLLCFAFKGLAVAEEVHPVVAATVVAHTLVRQEVVETAGLHICPVVEEVAAELRTEEVVVEAGVAAHTQLARQVVGERGEALRQQN